jgi:hypothetical protein
VTKGLERYNNPLRGERVKAVIWWLRQRLAELGELASDDAVLAANIGKADYAAVLLEMARARPANLIATGIATGSIERRIDRILSGGSPNRPVSKLRLALPFFAVIPLAALAADVTPKWESPSSDHPGATLFGMDARYPHIVLGPSLDDLKKWYPTEAKVRGIDGLVQMTVTLDEAGRATDTLVISESPSGMGFGAAASESDLKDLLLALERHPGDRPTDRAAES